MKRFGKFLVGFISIILIISLFGCNPKQEETEKAVSPEYQEEILDKQEENDQTEQVQTHTKEEKVQRENANVCSLLVDYSDVFEDISSLKEEKQSLISGNGIVLSLTEADFSEGESAFDVLKRELDKAKISLKYSKMPICNNVYIEGIDNICEFDCGKSSGWLYTVNGEYPMVSSGQYKLKTGDKIHFIYKRKAY